MKLVIWSIEAATNPLELTLSQSIFHSPQVTAFLFSCQCTLTLYSLTSTQHFFMQGCEAGQFEHAGWDVGPESHSAERWLTATLPKRCDVQAGHLVLHLCGTEEGRGCEKQSYCGRQLFLVLIVWCFSDTECKLRIFFFILMSDSNWEMLSGHLVSCDFILPFHGKFTDTWLHPSTDQWNSDQSNRKFNLLTISLNSPK